MDHASFGSVILYVRQLQRKQYYQDTFPFVKAIAPSLAIPLLSVFGCVSINHFDGETYVSVLHTLKEVLLQICVSHLCMVEALDE